MKKIPAFIRIPFALLIVAVCVWYMRGTTTISCTIENLSQKTVSRIEITYLGTNETVRLDNLNFSPNSEIVAEIPFTRQQARYRKSNDEEYNIAVNFSDGTTCHWKNKNLYKNPKITLYE